MSLYYLTVRVSLEWFDKHSFVTAEGVARAVTTLFEDYPQAVRRAWQRREDALRKAGDRGFTTGDQRRHSHESEGRAFYRTDRPKVAKGLCELFRSEEPETDPLSWRFEVVDASHLDKMPKRLRFRREVEALEAGTPDTDDAQSLTAKLASYHRQARQWEPLVRDELGIEGDSRVADAEAKPGPDSIGKAAQPTAERTPTPMPSGAADQPTGVDTPVTLKEFMEGFCTPLKKNLLHSRIDSLQSAARRGRVQLPEYEGQWKTGQTKKYRPTALLRAWPEYRKHLPNLPELKQFKAP